MEFCAVVVRNELVETTMTTIRFQEYARRIAKLSIECKLDIIEDKYVESFNPGMMDVVFQWVNGSSFAEVVKNTDIFEGSIIRCLRRLEEVLREMVNAAKSMQNQTLEEKFEEARVRIKRDIVFAASLYLYHEFLITRRETADDQKDLSPTDVGAELEPFDVPLPDLEKDAKPVTTLNEQCKRFVNHYRYYCRTSNIATYNEEIRIICERYRTYCSDRIRRQLAYWKHSGLPLGAQKSLSKCYSHCKETDPVCVNACECLHLQWVMDYECFPGVRAPAGPNCQRWVDSLLLLRKAYRGST
ncbi:DSHCT domain protein [Ancylostoma duodenale]|uniref:DSHCT domain protein n=1 Tax=Ancylostoma duodenale TaxID=51022 RepID=A0A0C2D7S0_9BILA|nr:DSHCT domain protein [Ancylostoma duodenale]